MPSVGFGDSLMMLRPLLLIAAIGAIAQTGCTSMSSTMLTRDESNSFWTRKAGLQGVPITLKVPTHVKLTVFERHFLVTDRNTGRAQRLPLPFVVRDFAQEFIYTEKIFTVDFKRPAAGQYNLKLDLSPDQYIQKLQLDVTDETITRVQALVGELIPRGFGGTPAGLVGERVKERIQEIQSVVAVGMFEIEAADFEEQMAGFVNCHLNQAHDAWVAPPSVSAVHRTRLAGFRESSDICGGLVVPNEVPLIGPPIGGHAPSNSPSLEDRQNAMRRRREPPALQ